MTVFLLSALIVLVASALHAATGFGFSILAVPLLLMIHEPLVAVQVNLILSIALSLLLVPTVTRDIDTTLLWRLVASSVLGIPLGVLMLLHLDIALFKVLIAVLTLVFTALLLLQLRFQRSPGRDWLSGLLAGGFTAAVGMGGVPLLLYFAGTQMPKAVVRGTVLAFFLFIYTLALGAQVAVTSSRSDIWWLSAALVPVALVGVWVGDWLFQRITQRTFRGAIYAVLVGNSAVLLWSAWRAA